MDELSAARTLSLRDHWVLLPILAIAAFLRLWQINESLWLDELHSAWVVLDGASHIVERAQIGNQSPLYFYLPWAATSLFGMSEWAMRLPSLVAGVGLVVLGYSLAFEFSRSSVAALTCAALAATDHNFLFYATEARPYACVELLAAAQLCLFWKLQNRDSMSWRLGFVAASAGMFYLHYTAILLLAGEILFSLVKASCRHKGSSVVTYPLRKQAVDLLGIAVLIVPAIAHMFDIGLRRGTWASFVNDTSLLLPVHWLSLDSYVVVPVALCLIVGVFKVAVTLRRDEPECETLESCSEVAFKNESNERGSSRRSVTATLLLLAWFVVPLASVWVLTVTKVAPLYLGRYVIGVALAPVLFTGICIGVWGNSRLQGLVASLVIASAIYSGGMIEQFRYDGRLFGDRAENWRDAVRYVNESDWLLDSPVFVRSGLLEADQLSENSTDLLRDYCVLPLTSMYRIDRPKDKVWPLKTHAPGSLSAPELWQIETSGGAWFVVNGDTAIRERCARRVLESLERQFQDESYPKIHRGFIQDEQQFGRVGVFAVLLYSLDDQVMPLDDQPTSPKSIAFP